MVARYGSAWTSKYGDSPEGLAGAEWRDTLSGVSREMLREGFHADVARADDFPPSSTRFRALCFGVPTFPALRYEFSHGEIPRTPFGLLCWQFVDSFALRRADQAEADRIVRDAYELGKAHVLAGGEVPEVHAALAAPTGPEVGKEPWRPLQISDDEHAACAPHVESLRKQFGIGA